MTHLQALGEHTRRRGGAQVAQVAIHHLQPVARHHSSALKSIGISNERATRDSNRYLVADRVFLADDKVNVRVELLHRPAAPTNTSMRNNSKPSPRETHREGATPTHNNNKTITGINARAYLEHADDLDGLHHGQVALARRHEERPARWGVAHAGLTANCCCA